jgi:hypothetical protein
MMRSRTTPIGCGVLLLACAGAVAGCGGADDFPNEPRPPAAIVVSAAISDRRVSVSPEGFGAGTVNLIVTNETGASQQITLRSRRLAGAGRALVQSTGPINPSDTATLKADLAQGTYTLSASARTIDPARIDVGSRRASAQNRLLQP